jgi:hypothetical protein
MLKTWPKGMLMSVWGVAFVPDSVPEEAISLKEGLRKVFIPPQRLVEAQTS